MSHNQRIGKWGEDTAAEYLTQRNYIDGDHKFHAWLGEIDVIAKQTDVAIFIDVKTRSSNTMGLPEEAITPRKREHMLAAADHYAAENKIDHWQIDVIAIEGKPSMKPVITYFENAI